jgi:glycerophosphoryl diester phosphodiesterase
MKYNTLFFALIITVFAASCGENKPHPNVLSENDTVKVNFKRDESYRLPANFDIQGHRGARGLFPENTTYGMIGTLQIEDVTTLEMDVVISKDNQVLLSHDPWLSSEICNFSNGDRMLAIDDEKFRIYEMTFDEIKKFDCGSRWNKKFPKQRPRGATKPLLTEIIFAVREYCAEEKRPDVNFNIEIKSKPEWDNFMTPPPAKFAKLVYDVVNASEVKDRITIQSFDVRSLQAIRALDPDLKLVLLVEGETNYKAKLKELGFTPAVYSPNYTLIDKSSVDELHKLGMKVIPWTVNDSVQMMKTIETGVDGIISDDPELLQRVARSYK